MEEQWLIWARKIRAIAQNGLTYSDGAFDRERYLSLLELASELFAHASGAEPATVLATLRAETGYATPKVDVRGVVFQGDTLLLMREREDGLWSLPGGWADVGESPSEAVTKEILEETGYRVRPRKLLAVWDRDRHGHPPLAWHVYKLVIRCELVGGVAADSIETEGAAFFPEHGIPPLSLGRVTPGQIARIFHHFRNPDLPTEYD